MLLHGRYDHYTYYPRLNNMKGQVQERILQAWQCVHDLVGEESYVVDFFYSPTKDKATLIELSPFLEVTGPAMFHWHVPVDRAILYNGPLTFRLREEPHPQAAELVEANWDLRWDLTRTACAATTYSSISSLPYWSQVQSPVQSILLAPESLAARRSVHNNVRSALKVARPPSREAKGSICHSGFCAKLIPLPPSPTQTWTSWPAWSDVYPGLTDALVSAGTILAVVLNHPALFIGGASRALGLLGFLFRLGWREFRSARAAAAQGRNELLFVYGTLKRGFQWHAKYLGDPVHGVEFLGPGVTTCELPLLVGDSGVPYLLGDLVHGRDGDFHQVHGELWSCSSDTLAGMDEFEGLSKGYYERKKIRVRVLGGTDTAGDQYGEEGGTKQVREAWVYCVLDSPPSLRSLARQGAARSNYPLDLHLREYHPIRHIQVKQQLHLSEPVGTPSEH